ncbi:MAG: hypothetical protein JST11_30675 [Acidobacteria bacterium]|nr:hypothetical protein [Acidobacteriota bacterium]
MTRKYSSFALGLLLCAAAQAATVSTTLNVTATGSIGASGLAVSGTASLTNIGSGTFTSSLSLTALGGATATAPYTIKLSSGDTITGNLLIPTTLITSALSGNGNASGTGSATVTGGTGAYAGATGSFPSLAGNGGLTSTGGFSFAFTGPGTITTSGSGGSGGGGGGGASGPTVTDVLDAGSYTKNIAQGSIFVVKGSNLSASGYTAMSFPLPTSSSGVKITFTPAAGGSGTDAYLVYLYNQGGVNQLAGVLPSTVAAGNYNVTVTNNGTASAPFSVAVVQRKLGLITANSGGTGLAVIQNYISASQLDIDRFTTFASGGYTFSPSKPGQVLIAWATGMGPVTGGDNTASPGYDFNANGVNVQVIVGGRSIKPLYAGRAPGLAGADQINFQLPGDITTGCTVSFQVSVNGQLSNPSFIAIAPDSGSNTCVLPGYTSAQLSKLDQGGTITVGGFGITQFQMTVPQVGSVKTNAISGGFAQISGFTLDSAAQVNSSVIQSGSCQIIQTTSSGTSTGTGTVKYLDAGTVSVTGPSGSSLSNTALTQTNNSYGISSTEGFSIPGQMNFSLPAGSYSLAGAGGNDVGSFNASITIGSPLTVTGGLPSSVTRSAGLTLNWTGGNPNDMVEIIGGASTSTGTGTSKVTTSTTFICLTTAGAGTFTVPASILTQLPTTTANNPGLLEVASGTSSTFTAPLKAGGSIDSGIFSSFVGTGNTPTYQ